jgi:hypothetical protein
MKVSGILELVRITPDSLGRRCQPNSQGRAAAAAVSNSFRIER